MADAGVASAPAEAAQAAVPAVIPDYQRGDLVWAKIKGFPWWPSQIRSVRNLRQRSEDHVPYVRVRFLHTKDNAEVAPDKLLPYTEANAELGIVKPKMFKSDGLKKKFLTAVAQADAWQPPPPAEPEEWSDDEVVEQVTADVLLRTAGNLRGLCHRNPLILHAHCNHAPTVSATDS